MIINYKTLEDFENSLISKGILSYIDNIKPLPENISNFVDQTNVLPCCDLDSNIRIDFIFSFSEYEMQAIKRANVVKVNEIEIKIAAFDDIIIHKLFANRPRDIEDLRVLLKIKKNEFDKEYILKWLKTFLEIPGKEDILKSFSNILN